MNKVLFMEMGGSKFRGVIDSGGEEGGCWIEEECGGDFSNTHYALFLGRTVRDM